MGLRDARGKERVHSQDASDSGEYGSTIYQVTTASGVVQYAYSIANIGTTGASVTPSSAPSGTTQVADIHTHGAYSFGTYRDNEFSGAHSTPTANLAETRLDIGDNNSTGLVGYVVTPNGSLQKYDPVTGNITTVNTNNPSDVNDPTRLNTVSSAPSPTSYKIQKGDTLTSLAKRFDTTVSAIATENKIADPNKIIAGQTITITN
jgi:LysM repeat protein